MAAMVEESLRRWIEVMKKFAAGERDNLLCPVNEDCYLKWEWIPAPGTGTGEYRLYSRKIDSRTGKRKNLGTFDSRAAAEKHERAVQYFKRRG